LLRSPIEDRSKIIDIFRRSFGNFFSSSAIRLHASSSVSSSNGQICAVAIAGMAKAGNAAALAKTYAGHGAAWPI
jgi:hypothetical protein